MADQGDGQLPRRQPGRPLRLVSSAEAAERLAAVEAELEQGPQTWGVLVGEVDDLRGDWDSPAEGR